MKRLFAISFSVLLLWTQAFAAVPSEVPHDVSNCACSACGSACCCVTPSNPESQPAPTAPVRAGVQNELLVFAPFSVAWTLPAAGSQIFSPASSSSQAAAGVPLFTRHCALLI